MVEQAELKGLFRTSYLLLDRRVLGGFRILFGGVLLYDLLRRFPDAALLWSSDGVLSSQALRKVPQDSSQFSLLFELTSGQAVQVAFVAMALVFALYTAGLYTRVMQVLALICYASLNARNLFFEDGGTTCVILLLGWTLFLPLGDWFSVDALRCEARLPNLASRLRARKQRRAPLVSLAALALLLQAAAIYWLNAAHKTGHTWRAGDAVHLVLWQHRVNTPFAVWLAAHQPSWFSPLFSWLTVRTEFLLPLLLLWPWRIEVTRPIAFALALGLHAGIALTLTLGPFSYVMICLVWLCLPGGALDAVRSRLPRRLGWRLAQKRARLLSRLRRWRGSSPPRRFDWFGLGSFGPRLREAVLGLMLVVELCSLLQSNRAIPKALKPGHHEWLLAYKAYLRGWQGWSMFAPNAPDEDGTMVIDAVTKSGRHIDPFTGQAPDFEQVRRGVVPHSIAVSDYLFNMRNSRNRRYRHDLRRYLRRYADADDRIVSAEVFWVSYVPPKRGSHEPGPIKKELLWKIKT
ncbi:MAG TPA: HTTM domain-containing protein [Polyangiaceae bacterium]|nr:HTTM domain-containing protein [Polyangiaceae bacterium]